MTNMSCLLAASLSRANQGIGRNAPMPGGVLTHQDEATGARACELNKASCRELSAAALRIEQGAHRLNHGVRLSGHRDGRNNDPDALLMVRDLAQDPLPHVDDDFVDGRDRKPRDNRRSWPNRTS
jgi:hypothetical protein